MPNGWLGADELRVLGAFINAEVRFIIIGGRAVQFHGHKRLTKDLDLLIEASQQNGKKLMEALKSLGTTFTKPEALEKLSEDRRVKGSVCFYPVEYLTAINGVRFVDAWADAVPATVEGVTVHVLSKPHLIVSKQNTGRALDAEDVKALSGYSLTG
jgi:predicted nucleotidyltransferase